MSARVRRHLRSNVVGYLALFIALSASAYAGGKLGPSDIKRNAIRSQHVKNGSLRSKDVQDGSLSSRDIKPGGLNGADLAANSVGGQQIDESSLGTVPSAADADRIDGVDSADLIQGSGAVRAAAGGSQAGSLAVLMDEGPLRLVGFCEVFGGAAVLLQNRGQQPIDLWESPEFGDGSLSPDAEAQYRELAPLEYSGGPVSADPFVATLIGSYGQRQFTVMTASRKVDSSHCDHEVRLFLGG